MVCRKKLRLLSFFYNVGCFLLDAFYLFSDSLEDCDVTSECLSTLSRLCVRAEYCQEALDKGALKIINDILVSFQRMR